MPKVAGVDLISVLILSVIHLGASHSWLTCLDCASDNGKDCTNCRGYPRNWHKNPSVPFGQDVRRDMRPRSPPPGGLKCLPDEAINNPVSGGYSPSAPMAKLTAGQKITLTWPAKNHAMVGIQRGVQLFISKTPNGGDDFSHITSQAAWVSKYPELQKTFSNCNPNRRGVDRAFCKGEFTLPTDLKPGVYTFMWWWEFNAGEYYNSCADAEIIVKPPPTPPPTPKPRPPTLPPCTQAKGASSVKKVSTCPGDGNDCSVHHDCCGEGKKCYYKSNYTAGCLASCPGKGYINPDDPDHLRTPWECTDFSPAEEVVGVTCDDSRRRRRRSGQRRRRRRSSGRRRRGARRRRNAERRRRR
mmetsp:Transcript_100293/g.189175  ORF Transcript_100293/g.189175 Transcript_100293/m.189175 type:complete len:356 (+) Transcript_100293:72-1139(+)